ncbi:hypothetical protein M5689_014719 [Euphorbia peplus]|nr:hypothetical protein M5689_014719 [Euphorbia peplus]
MTTSNLRYILGINKSIKPRDNNPKVTCDIEYHILYRYQLTIPTKGGVHVVVEDIVAPLQRFLIKIPIHQFCLSLWVDSCLKDLVNTLSLEYSVVDFMKPKIEEAASQLIRHYNSRRGNHNGYTMVVQLGIFKVDFIEQDEANNILRGLIKPISSKS